ncbi:CRISPR-associated protein, Cse4 family [hydrothermal vent metagenome]|uniref:CRISPR-associated protein, Cse4 family n=1 Tax=hydrothermal vent metagenome TaxID=652676 RepID=A0A3B0VSE7_9ZZZZ
MFIELHTIQNFSPANLNRDDTNNPKDCEFGGYRRARISSQSLKRAIRFEPVFADTTQAKNGERSKWMTRPIKKQLIVAGKTEEEASKVASSFVEAYASKMDSKKPNKTAVLIYFSQEEIATVVNSLLENWDDALIIAQSGKKLDKLATPLIKATQDRTSAPDIALFGRMLAEKPTLNIDAACQVAHAISTHRINMEMDFYTAVEEIKDLEEDADEGAGAAMMGFTNFNSACFYRYVRIDWRQLVSNLGGDKALAQRTVEGFLRAAIDAIPTGKQNSFAAQNPTSMAMAVVRKDGKSWNLANAFEMPVYASGKSGLITPSIEALDSYWDDITTRRDDATLETIAVWTDSTAHEQALDALKGHHHLKLNEWATAVTHTLPTNEEA